MATNDPDGWTGTATIASTSYPAAASPSLDATTTAGTRGAGYWAIYNPGTIAVIASQNSGIDDLIRIPAGTGWNSPTTNLHGKLWLKLASAGSVTVEANFIPRHVMEGLG